MPHPSRSRARAALSCLVLTALTVLGVAVPGGGVARAEALPPQLALAGGSRQVLVVTAAGPDTPRATIEGWQRDAAGTWSRFLPLQPAVVGQYGLSPAASRVQGNRRTPAGTFPLLDAFGVDPDPGTRIPYERLDADDYWVGDQADPATYNLFQPSRPSTARWRTSEAERLASETVAYRYAVNIGFNVPGGVYTAADGQRRARVPADTRTGSAIFLHAFGTTGRDGYTAGCVAMDRTALAGVLRALDPALSPAIVIGTAFAPPTEADERWVDALYLDLLGRRSDPTGREGWAAEVASGRLSRYAVALSLARSDEYLGAVVSRLYREVLGREPDAAGLAAWVASLRRGTTVAAAGASFYASPEAYARAGATAAEPGPWVESLYRALLGRPSDAAGKAAWVQAARASGRGAVAAGFYGSPESLAHRVQGLYATLLGRPADPAGLASWPAVVARQGDLALAAYLTSSPEYVARAQTR